MKGCIEYIKHRRNNIIITKIVIIIIIVNNIAVNIAAKVLSRCDFVCNLVILTRGCRGPRPQECE